MSPLSGDFTHHLWRPQRLPTGRNQRCTAASSWMGGLLRRLSPDADHGLDGDIKSVLSKPSDLVRLNRYLIPSV